MEDGVWYPQGRAAQILGNKNAWILAGLLSPLTADGVGVGVRGGTVMNWIKCESKKAPALKRRERQGRRRSG